MKKGSFCLMAVFMILCCHNILSGNVWAEPCTGLPAQGDWIVDQSCTLQNTYNAKGDVRVENGAILTLDSAALLNVDFIYNNLTVKNGGGLQILPGGAIKHAIQGTGPIKVYLLAGQSNMWDLENLKICRQIFRQARQMSCLLKPGQIFVRTDGGCWHLAGDVILLLDLILVRKSPLLKAWQLIMEKRLPL